MIKYVNNEKTKNHSETNEDIEDGGIIPHISESEKSPFSVIQKYIEKLHPENTNMWQVAKSVVTPSDKTWYTKKVIGINLMSTMMKTICKFCDIGTIYTNHSLRAAACTILGQLGYSDIEVKSISKHKSISSLSIYRRVKTDRKEKMASDLASIIGIQGTSRTNEQVSASLPNTIKNLEQIKRDNNNYNLVDLPNIPSHSFNNIDIDEIMCDKNDFPSLITAESGLPSLSIAEIEECFNCESLNAPKLSAELSSNITVHNAPAFFNCSNITINYNKPS